MILLKNRIIFVCGMAIVLMGLFLSRLWDYFCLRNVYCLLTSDMILRVSIQIPYTQTDTKSKPKPSDFTVKGTLCRVHTTVADHHKVHAKIDAHKHTDTDEQFLCKAMKTIKNKWYLLIAVQ